MSFSVRVSVGVPARARQVLEEAGLRVDSGPIDRASLAGRAYDALLPLLTDRIDGPLMQSVRGLRLVANMAAGTDNVDLVAAGELGIAVSNTPDVLTDATADLAFALLLAAARNLVHCDRLVRAGGFRGWTPSLGLGHAVAGRTLGVVGAGRIGGAVARRARGFDMRVLELRRASELSLDELLEQSDFVSLHVPLTSDTRHLIGERELARMKPTSILVNTARGPIVDERALVRALSRGVIAAAALDVYEHEPDLTPGLADLPNVVLAPHVGSATRETRDRMAETAARNITALAAAAPLPNPIPVSSG